MKIPILEIRKLLKLYNKPMAIAFAITVIASLFVIVYYSYDDEVFYKNNSDDYIYSDGWICEGVRVDKFPFKKTLAPKEKITLTKTIDNLSPYVDYTLDIQSNSDNIEVSSDDADIYKSDENTLQGRHFFNLKKSLNDKNISITLSSDSPHNKKISIENIYLYENGAHLLYNLFNKIYVYTVIIAVFWLFVAGTVFFFAQKNYTPSLFLATCIFFCIIFFSKKSFFSKTHPQLRFCYK